MNSEKATSHGNIISLIETFDESDIVDVKPSLQETRHQTKKEETNEITQQNLNTFLANTYWKKQEAKDSLKPNQIICTKNVFNKEKKKNIMVSLL